MEKAKPRIIIAATKSGSGKTLITCALLKALKDRGRKVQAFKCGPDYIDPMFHRKIIDIPSKNLDLFFTNEAQTTAIFLDNNNADISVIEGVMGLYDGVGGTSEQASAYHVAKTLKTPVILVIDAKGMGRSILAEIAGFLSMDSEKLIKGIILNRITKGYFETIKPLIESKFNINVIGYYPILKDLKLESRYLGLKLPNEIADIRENVLKAADELEKSVDVDMILDIAAQTPYMEDTSFEDEVLKAASSVNAGSKDAELKDTELQDAELQDTELKDAGSIDKCVDFPVIAVANDEAFCFLYEDNIHLLERYGARIKYFSPLRDSKLPDNISAILLPGGYPELFAKELSENKSMKASMRQAIAKDVLVVAECGGFMYLHKSIITEDKSEYEMIGAIDAKCSYTGHLVRFGYIEIAAEPLKDGNYMASADKLLCSLNKNPIRGHEFHYYDSSDNGCGCRAVKPITNKSWNCIYAKNNIFAGFPHLYYPSNPTFAQQIVECLQKNCK